MLVVLESVIPGLDRDGVEPCAQRAHRLPKLCNLVLEMLLLRLKRCAVTLNALNNLVLVYNNAALLLYYLFKTRDEHC